MISIIITNMQVKKKFVLILIIVYHITASMSKAQSCYYILLHLFLRGLNSLHPLIQYSKLMLRILVLAGGQFRYASTHRVCRTDGHTFQSIRFRCINLLQVTSTASAVHYLLSFSYLLYVFFFLYYMCYTLYLFCLSIYDIHILCIYDTLLTIYYFNCSQ